MFRDGRNHTTTAITAIYKPPVCTETETHIIIIIIIVITPSTNILHGHQIPTHLLLRRHTRHYTPSHPTGTIHPTLPTI